MNTKQTVEEIADSSPDRFISDEELYRRYVVEMARRGIAEAEAGLGIPHEQVVAHMRRKWPRGAV